MGLDTSEQVPVVKTGWSLSPETEVRSLGEAVDEPDSGCMSVEIDETESASMHKTKRRQP